MEITPFEVVQARLDTKQLSKPPREKNAMVQTDQG